MAEIDQIMVAEGSEVSPGTEDVKLEDVEGEGGGGGFDPSSLSVSTNTPVDADEIVTGESGTWYRKAFSKVWDYIKGKLGISSQGSTGKYLDEQGNFTTPPNTTYNVVSTLANGLAPQVTDTNGYLKGDGPWSVPSGGNSFDIEAGTGIDIRGYYDDNNQLIKTIRNSGVTDIYTESGDLYMTKDGARAYIDVPYATKASQDGSGNNIESSYAASLVASGVSWNSKQTVTLKNKNNGQLSQGTIEPVVKENNTTSGTDYRIHMSWYSDNDDNIAECRKSPKFTLSPSNGTAKLGYVKMNLNGIWVGGDSSLVDSYMGYANSSGTWQSAHVCNSSATFSCSTGGFGVVNKSWNGNLPCTASAFTVSSSRALKTDIKTLTEEDAKLLLQLRPVTFAYKSDPDKKLCKGLIAEEAKEVDESQVSQRLLMNNETDVDEHGNRLYSIDYSKYVPQLIKLCQMQQAEIDLLKAEVAELKKGNA